MVILSVWAVVLLGLPLWWTTTRVYRAELPYESINKWKQWEVMYLTPGYSKCTHRTQRLGRLAKVFLPVILCLDLQTKVPNSCESPPL